MEAIQSLFGQIKEFLNLPLFKIGGTQLTLWALLYSLALLVLLVSLTSKLKTWVVNKVLARSKVDIGVRQAGGTILQYVVVVIGVMIILQTAGIDLTTLNVLAGAVGIGVGFGLQNIANNFISGLIILFELRAWSSSLVHRKGKLISSLNFAIYDRFTAQNIEIPFPQRDVHIRSRRIERQSLRR